MNPLTPPDCDLTDFPRMMIDITRLRSSGFDATLDDGAWRAGFNLWFSAWHQVPAASLPNDDGSLCKFAGLGRDLKSWKKVRAEAMRGWSLCNDGLLYHETVAEIALESWLEKLAQRISSGAGNAKRYRHAFDAAPIYAKMEEAVDLLTALNPQSKIIARTRRRLTGRAPDDLPAGEPEPPGGSPPASQETETETGTPLAAVAAREGFDDWPDGKASDHAKTLEALNTRIDSNRRVGLVTSVGEIARWRMQGYSWALDVIPIVTAHAVRARADPVGTWAYFSQPIAQAHANRTRPAETVDPQASHERRNRPADKFERHQANLERAVAGSQIAARLRAIEPEGSF